MFGGWEFELLSTAGTASRREGFARALWPSHTPMDGDIVFAIATGRAEAEIDMIALGSAGAACMARAIARGVFAATPAAGDLLPTWREKFG